MLDAEPPVLLRKILDAQFRDFFPAQRMEQQHGEDRPVALAFQCIGRGAARSARACASPSAGVLLSKAATAGRFTPRTGLCSTALHSHR